MLGDDIAISVRNLTKTYRLFAHPGDRIKQFPNLGDALMQKLVLAGRCAGCGKHIKSAT
jgi:hypothetical protein